MDSSKLETTNHTQINISSAMNSAKNSFKNTEEESKIQTNETNNK